MGSERAGVRCCRTVAVLADQRRRPRWRPGSPAASSARSWKALVGRSSRQAAEFNDYLQSLRAGLAERVSLNKAASGPGNPAKLATYDCVKQRQDAVLARPGCAALRGWH